MSGQSPVIPSASDIEAAAKASQAKGLPPVDTWNPPLSGKIDIRIARDGTWYHEGTRMTRPGLVRLFSTILKREGDAYFLVTPVEKWQIEVEDAPFVAVDFTATGEGEMQVLRFTTNLGDTAVAGETLPLRIVRDYETDEPSPYIMVRSGLEALIDRKSFYRLVDLGAHHEGWFGVWSQNCFFPIAPSDTIDPD
ncbi:DUF1285 domain-containing protein [Lutimaribacter marinistellae]